MVKERFDKCREVSEPSHLTQLNERARGKRLREREREVERGEDVETGEREGRYRWCLSYGLQL